MIIRNMINWEYNMRLNQRFNLICFSIIGLQTHIIITCDNCNASFRSKNVSLKVELTVETEGKRIYFL